MDPNPDLKRALLKRKEEEKMAARNREKADLEAKIKLDQPN